MASINITIEDSGIRSVVCGGTETVIANSGNAITLHIIDFSPKQTTLLNTQATQRFKSDSHTNEFAGNEVDKMGILNREWILRGTFDVDDSTDKDAVGYLAFMERTKGYKTIKTTDDSSNTNIMRLLSKDVSNTAITDINCRIVSIDWKQDYVRYEKGHIISYTLIVKETT